MKPFGDDSAASAVEADLGVRMEARRAKKAETGTAQSTKRADCGAYASFSDSISAGVTGGTVKGSSIGKYDFRPPLLPHAKSVTTNDSLVLTGVGASWDSPDASSWVVAGKLKLSSKVKGKKDSYNHNYNLDFSGFITSYSHGVTTTVDMGSFDCTANATDTTLF